MPVRLDLKVIFGLASGLHVTGDRAELWIDKAVVLGWGKDKKPIVPATSIKGWLRENAERVLKALGREVCDSSQPSSICGSCVICRVFGHPRGRARLFFEDARFESSEMDIRTSVSLSRHRKTSYEERLFTTEVVWGGKLVVKGWGFFDTVDKAIEAAAFVWLAAKAGFALGAARSRGLGWLTMEKFTALCDGREIAEEELAEEARKLPG